MNARAPQEIFFSHSNADPVEWNLVFAERYVDTARGPYHLWADPQLRVGTEWESTIRDRIAASSAAVMLVSRRFLASEVIARLELEPLLERARREPSYRIVWIPLDVSFDEVPATLRELQAAVKKPLPEGPDATLVKRICDCVNDAVSEAIDSVGHHLLRALPARYELCRQPPLGEGSSAVTYRVRDQDLDRHVAVKVLREKGQRGMFRRDLREAARTADLAHFVTLYDYVETDASTYCIEQLVEGTTLRRHLQDAARDPAREIPRLRVPRILISLASALGRAHAKGVTCGNLKPSNIVLSEDFQPFILPSARASRTPEEEDDELRLLLGRIEQRESAGLPRLDVDDEDLRYLLPERFCPRDEIDDPKQADQYMLGLIAYELIARAPPPAVDGWQRRGDRWHVEFKPLPELIQIHKPCPRRISDMVAMMTALKPEKRYRGGMADVFENARHFVDLHVGLATASYARCIEQPDFDARFFHAFYARLLQRRELARVLAKAFGALPAPGIAVTSKKWIGQFQMLRQALHCLLSYRKGDASPNVLTRVADKHAAIAPADIEAFVVVLIEAVGDFDPECRGDPALRQLIVEAWHDAVAPGVDYITQVRPRERQPALEAA